MIAPDFDATKLFRLDGKIALVVGAASGIGEACAVGLAQCGARVIAADVNADGVAATVSRIEDDGGDAEADIIDVRSTESVNAVVRGAVDRHGRIDVLLATPAINIRKRLVHYRRV